MRIIEIDNYDLATLEKLHYQVRAYESLLKNISSGGKSEEDLFKKTFNDYVPIFTEYEKEKQRFNDEFVNRNKIKSDVMWEINFEKKQLNIYEEND